MRLAILAPALALRAGLRAILTSSSPLQSVEEALDVVFEASSLEEFLAYRPQTDVLLVDGELVDSAGLQEIAEGHEEGKLGILILSDNPQQARALIGLALRGWGILPVDASAEELQAAARAVGEGLIAGAPAILKPLLVRPGIVVAADTHAPVETLTERESQVLQLIALGLPNKLIAQQLNISEHTVKFHISSIYGKLGATNRTEAVRTGVQRGLISL
jgi:NarL family two-component system response regulator YdfI